MPQVERFAVGSIECQIVPDGVAMYEPADLAAGVPVDQIIAALKAGVDEKGEMAVPYNCLLIRAGGRIALVDTGLGAEEARQFGEPAGRLMDSLAASGIAADQVDLVIISHAHLDHIGGLTVAAGGGRVPVFARARHYFWRAEWDFWTSGEGLAQAAEELVLRLVTFACFSGWRNVTPRAVEMALAPASNHGRLCPSRTVKSVTPTCAVPSAAQVRFPAAGSVGDLRSLPPEHVLP